MGTRHQVARRLASCARAAGDAWHAAGYPLRLATLPRVDILFADTMGGVNYLAGTPSATPVAPAVPITTFPLLAEISVPAGTAAITTA